MSLRGGGNRRLCPSRPMASHCIAKTLPPATFYLSQAESGPTVMRAATLLLIQACLEFRREGRERLASQITSWRHRITKLCALESLHPFGMETRSWHCDWNLMTCPRFRIGVKMGI